MKSLVSFMKKEYLEAARTGKIVILLFLFLKNCVHEVRAST